MSDFMESTKELVKSKLAEISKFKERYLEAWIAETRLHPSECELIQQEGFQDKETWGTRIFVRRREGDNLIEKSQYRTIKCLEAENQRLRDALLRITETLTDARFLARKALGSDDATTNT